MLFNEQSEKLMNFYKMEGLGNDFVVTHEVKENEIQHFKNQFVSLCDRRRGVGADGIIFVLPSENVILKCVFSTVTEANLRCAGMESGALLFMLTC